METTEKERFVGRYIRTKDGHFVDTSVYKKVVERTFNGKVVAIDLNHWGQDSDKEITYIPVEDIVRQADTIEELVDAYVTIHENDPYYDELNSGSFIVPPASMELYLDLYMKDETIKTIFGAIWTDKGLIYVAKMNDKGELELL